MDVGFIGVGVMGSQMVKNLVARGYPVTAFDLRPEALATVAAYGAKVAPSVAAACTGKDAVLLSLPDPAACEKVMLGPEGVLAVPHKPGLLVVDLSTSLPDTAKKIHQAAKEVGVDYLDSPISGGPAGCAAGTLTMMVGADPEVFERASPLLNDMGKLVVRLGPIGMGCAAKLLNNLAVNIITFGIIEVLVLGSKVGLDPRVLDRVVRNSSGRSYIWEKMVPSIIARQFTPPAFTMDLQYKDTVLVTQMAESLGVPVPVAQLIKQLIAMGRQLGLGPEEYTALIKLYEMFAKVEVR